jgi:hypothetical protein
MKGPVVRKTTGPFIIAGVFREKCGCQYSIGMKISAHICQIGTFPKNVWVA